MNILIGVIFILPGLVIMLLAIFIFTASNKYIKNSLEISIGEVIPRNLIGKIIAIKGKIVCDSPLISPLSKISCIYYNMDVDYMKGGERRNIAHREEFAPFEIKDGTGRARIDPINRTDSENTAIYEPEDMETIHRKVPEQGDLEIGGFSLQALLAEKGLDLDKIRGCSKKSAVASVVPITFNDSQESSEKNDAYTDREVSLNVKETEGSHSCRFHEQGIPIDREVFVIGQAHHKDGAVEFRPYKKSFLIISLKNKKELIKSNRWGSFFVILFGAVFVAAGIVIMMAYD